jgi:cytochrome c
MIEDITIDYDRVHSSTATVDGERIVITLHTSKGATNISLPASEVPRRRRSSAVVRAAPEVWLRSSQAPETAGVIVQYKISHIAVVLAIAGMMATTAAVAAGDPVQGGVVFEECVACHSLEAGKNDEVGPTLHGLFGRKPAAEDYLYSPALRRANISWTPELLDAFLANPQSGVFRGNRMPFAGMSDTQARADLIAYLEQATK